ncbi:hypothetical protein GCM10022226_69580 [Sphaerisporangium flaviroseum]|uniref:Uncharacterized protein n=1 Tax=Sphaerisporangium flaviroseum TaxID=509199 RepID=A0ABP7J8C4_9ACTN
MNDLTEGRDAGDLSEQPLQQGRPAAPQSTYEDHPNSHWHGPPTNKPTRNVVTISRSVIIACRNSKGSTCHATRRTPGTPRMESKSGVRGSSGAAQGRWAKFAPAPPSYSIAVVGAGRRGVQMGRRGVQKS